MDKLEIKIVLSYKIPEKDLTINGILRGLQEDQNKLMRNRDTLQARVLCTDA